MIILWLTRRQDEASETTDDEAVLKEALDSLPEATPDVKGMLTGRDNTLAPVSVVRLNQHHN